jgi:hypothetical protein
LFDWNWIPKQVSIANRHREREGGRARAREHREHGEKGELEKWVDA